MKICTSCKEEKPFSSFQIRAASKDGFTARCKGCLAIYDRARANLPKRVKARLDYQKTEAYRVSSRKSAKKYSRNNKEKRQESTSKYREKNKVKVQCHGIVAYAIKCGNLIKKDCEVCGAKNVNAHHDDYAKPLDVRWLCSLHHNEWHKINGEGRNAN